MLFIAMLMGSVEAAPSFTSITQNPNTDIQINTSVQYTMNVDVINADLSFNSEVRMKESGVDITNEFSFQFVFQDPDTTCPFLSGRFSCFSDDVPFDPVSTPYTIQLIFNWTPTTAGLRTIDFEFTTGGNTQTMQISTNVIAPNGIAQLSSTTYSVDEGATTAIQLHRVGGNAGTLTVHGLLGDVSDTATVADYDAPGRTFTATWFDGQSAPIALNFPDVYSDSIVEGAETFTVTLTGVDEAGGAVGSPSQAVVTINDLTVPNPGTIQFYRNFFEGPETRGFITVSAERTSGSDGVAEVDVDFLYNSTLSLADIILPASTRLSWAGGESGVKSFDVQLVQDADEGASESTSIELVPVGGTVLGSPKRVAFVVYDNTAFYYSSDNYQTSLKEGESFNYSIERVGNNNNSQDIDVIINHGTTNSSDFDPTATTQLSWAAGEVGIKTASIPILFDTLIEPAEDFAVTFQYAGAGNFTTTSTLSVANAVQGILQFDSVSYSANEGASATINVSRVGGADGVLAATIIFGQVGDTASSSDYTDPASVQLDWADGDSATKTLSIPINTDLLVEGDETLTLTLSSPTPSVLGTPAQTILTIADQTIGDGVMQFSSASYSGDEGSVIDIQVDRVGGSIGSLTGFIDLGDFGMGTDTASVADYNYPLSSSVTWADGDNAPKIISIPVNTDVLVEGTETLSILLSATLGTSLGDPVQATLSINDTTTPGLIEFESSTYSAAEGNTATVNVTRTGGSDGAYSANIVTGLAGDSATLADYTFGGVTTTLNWADGDSATKSLSVQLSDDVIVEGTEVLTFTLASGTPAILGTVLQTTLSIVDTTTSGTIQFDSTTYTTSEGGNAAINVSRTGGSDGPITATLSLGAIGDSATTADYITPASLLLNWVDGDSNTKTVLLPAINDTLVEGTELVTVNLGSVNTSILGMITQSAIIIDDATSPGTLQFESAIYSVTEGQSVTINVSRVGGSDGAYSAAVVVSGGSANNTDYSDPGSVQLNWADGESSTKSLTINTSSDINVEGDETIVLSLSSATPAILGSPANTTITVIDASDPGIIQLDNVSYSVIEGGSIDIGVVRTGGSSGIITATIDFGVNGDTATSTDYTTPVPATVSWQDGESGLKIVTLQALNDGQIEGNETLNITLNSTIAGVLGNPVQATVQINDRYINYVGSRQTPNSVVSPGTIITYSVEMTIAGSGTSFFRNIPVTNNGVNVTSEMTYKAGDSDISIACPKNTITETFDCSYTHTTNTLQNYIMTFEWQATQQGLNQIIFDFGGSSQTTVEFNTYVQTTPLSNLTGLNLSEQSIAVALDNGCLALSQLDTGGIQHGGSNNNQLTAAQKDLLTTCLDLADSSDISGELQKLIPEEISSQLTAAFAAANLQVRNVNTRLTSLRGGAKGIDLSGINLSIDGEVIPGSVLNMALNNSSNSNDIDLGIQRWGAFVNANVSFGEKGTSLFSEGFEFDARGITAGVDYRESRDKVFGLAIGYDTNETTFSGDNAGMDMDSIHLSLYGSWYKPSNFYLDALIKLGWNDYDTRRNVTLTGNPQQLLSGSTKSIENSLSLGAGYDKTFKALSIGGYGRFDYTYVAINGYNESASNQSAPGIGSILHIDSQTLDSITATAGSELSYSINTKRAVYVPQLRLEWAHLIRDNRSTIDAQFIHDPTSTTFSVATEEKPDTDYFNIGTGISVITPRGKSGFFYIEKRFDQDNAEQTWIKGGIRIEF